MQNTNRNGTTLVIGASGKTGRRVMDRLITQGRRVRPVSRSTVPRFDWQDDSTWAPALDGVDAAYITYFPDLALPGAAETVDAFARLAVESGVRRQVLLSGRGEEGAQRAERYLQNSGADWTIVRCAFFNQNFDENFVDSVRHGVLGMPAGDTAEPFVDADDIADVVVAALTDDRHIGQLYELTGPRLLTLAEAAHELGCRHRPRGAVRPSDRRGVRRRAGRAGDARGGRHAPRRTAHRGARRPQFTSRRWRPAGTGTPASRLRRLCEGHRRDGRVESRDGGVVTVLTILCAVGAAAAGGALFTFSDFTMAGLKRLPAAQGIAAMQAINKAAPSPLFMLLLFGTGSGCLAMMVIAGMHIEEPVSTLRLVAGGLYVVGVVFTTMVYHVPRNDRLDRADPESDEGAEFWATYQREWIPMNHVRTLAALVAAMILGATSVVHGALQ